MASDYLLVIDGIKGESQDKEFKDSIEVDSFQWGEANSGSSAAGGGGGAGKVSFSDLTFSTHVNKASPLIGFACADGKVFKSAVLHVRKQGDGKQQEFYTVTLSDVLVTSYNSSGHGGPGLPMESFSLNFAKFKFEYKHQKPDGSLDPAIKFEWDIKAGSKV